MNTNYPNEKWHRFYLDLAKVYATKSKDPSTKVGAVIVSSYNRVVGLGYNGFPEGVEDSPELLNDRATKLDLMVHAEVNACANAGHAAIGSTLYVYPSFALPPVCKECCKVVIANGIANIIGFVTDENDERALRWKDSIAVSKSLCDKAGVKYFGLKE